MPLGGRWLPTALSRSNRSECSQDVTTAASVYGGVCQCKGVVPIEASHEHAVLTRRPAMRIGDCCSVSDGVSAQRLFGHRICDVCKGTHAQSILSSLVVVTLASTVAIGESSMSQLARMSWLPGDGLTEESYREKMFDKAEAREEMRQALVEEGSEARLAIYAEVHGEDAAAAQRKPKREKKKKKKKKKKAQEEEEEEEAEAEEDGEYVDEDAAELARQAQEERLGKMQDDGEEDEYDETGQEEGDDDDDEYGGME